MRSIMLQCCACSGAYIVVKERPRDVIIRVKGGLRKERNETSEYSQTTTVRFLEHTHVAIV